MTIAGLPSSATPAHWLRIDATLALYGSALFLSALLLFAVEPMFAKMVLPKLGGSPSVWSVAMVFFQVMLLAGYFYAHLLTRYFAFPVAFALHALVLGLAMLALPIGFAHGFGRPPEGDATLWLIGLFAASVGLPFFAVAGNGPLLQAWFARCGHAAGTSPYFLYGASNIGSFAALLAYPLLIEPNLTLREQSQAWMMAYLVLALVIGLCAWRVLRGGAADTIDSSRMAVERPSWRERCAWASLAFVPSGLLIAVTAHLSTDVASAPFLWAVPLALYLVTFVLIFRDRALVSHRLMLLLQPFFIGVLAMLFALAWWIPLGIVIPAHLGAFFVATMVCHGELYRRRPAPIHLTEFYLWMSFGGALGGIFAGLAAPHLFATVVEYPLLTLAALMARPRFFATPLRLWPRELRAIAGLGLVLLAPGLLFGFEPTVDDTRLIACAFALLAGLVILHGERPLRLLALAAIALAATRIYQPGTLHPIYARSFFGVHKVVDMGDGHFRALFHGTTLHGAERLTDDSGAPLTGPPKPLSYYYRGGPFQEAIAARRAANGGRLPAVAVVGMGIGALACSRQDGENWTFYEIDPEVVRLATKSGLFRTMATCAQDQKIITGDARLSLADTTQKYDLIILDAFSSDTVPVHLLTREALALYAERLTTHGAIAFNISNRNVELADVVAGAAAANHMLTVDRIDDSPIDFFKTFRLQAEIAVVAHQREDVADLGDSKGWRLLMPDPNLRIWTDDYSDIVGAILRKWRRGGA